MAQVKIVMDNWMEYRPVITTEDLGWSEDSILDARSENPKDIFDYFWKNFFSITFYYVDNGKFYELFMESNPHKVWEVLKKPDWDGRYVGQQIAWESHEEGNVICTFDDDTDLWNVLKIDGKSIGEVLSRSLIAEIE